ncbi:hypothetical protein ACFC1I_15655 [Microbacterium sp. NPDC056044]|uniref:hypothetical protein n=1 Tax=Microbacterium sp. NPDC056044 TaxID=3345690 RepID=UPI0035D7CCC5
MLIVTLFLAVLLLAPTVEFAYNLGGIPAAAGYLLVAATTAAIIGSKRRWRPSPADSDRRS